MADIKDDLSEFGVVYDEWFSEQTLEDANADDKTILLELYAQKLENSSSKVDQVKSLFEKYEIPSKIKAKIESYTQLALATLDEMDIDTDKKQNLSNFALWLMNRAV